jgi:hypothetical protein
MFSRARSLTRRAVFKKDPTNRRTTHKMGLSIEELELQSSECLPAREVMTVLGGKGASCNADSSTENNQASQGVIAANVGTGDIGILNGNNVQVCDILNNNNFLNNVLSYNG